MFIKDYLALASEDKVLITKRQIEDERTPKEWIKTLKDVANVDEQGDTIRKVSYRVGIFGIVLLAISIISIFLEFSGLTFLFIPGIILAIPGFAIYFISKNFDLPSELIKEAIIPILLVLHEDIKNGERVNLKLDLRGFLQSDKADGQTEDHSHPRHKITNYFYIDPWCEGKTTLADGTKLVWDIKNYVRHRVKKRYGSSGKSKGTIIKNKSKSLVTVKAGVDKRKFVLPPKLKQKGEEGKIHTQRQDGMQWMTVRRMFKHGEGESFHPQYFIDPVASVYMRTMPKGGSK